VAGCIAHSGLLWTVILVFFKFEGKISLGTHKHRCEDNTITELVKQYMTL